MICKKRIAAVLAALLCLSLFTACSGTEESKQTESQTAAPTEAQTDPMPETTKALNTFSGAEKIEELDRRIKALYFIPNEEMPDQIIIQLPGVQFVGTVSTGIINIYEFSLGDDVTFYLSQEPEDDGLRAVTYFLNGKEYAYNSGQTSFTVSSETAGQSEEKIENVNIKITPEDATAIARKELQKAKYKDYVSSIGDNRWCYLFYREYTGDYLLQYESTPDYGYDVCVQINTDDSEYNECAVFVDAQTGEVTAVDFYNSYGRI